MRYALAGTVVLTGAALWWPRHVPLLVAAAPRVGGATTEAREQAATALPARLEAQDIEAAKRDPFVDLPPEPEPSAPVPRPPPIPAPLTAAPPSPVSVAATPQPPPLTLRYLGAVLTPAGQKLLLLARGDTAVSIQPGTTLEEGYVVQSISDDAVRLVYPPLGTVVDIRIPPSQATFR